MGKVRGTRTIAWHPGFCGCIGVELSECKNSLEFIPENPLNKEPLRTDLLIIKKEPGAKLPGDYGDFFRAHNILEYKSPGDGLSIDDFCKTIGYAMIYKSTGKKVNAIPLEELTVSIYREAYPQKLMKHLTTSGARIERDGQGIYRVCDFVPLPVRIVVIKELSREHFALRMLSKDIGEADIENFVHHASAMHDQGDRINISAIMHVSAGANRDVFNAYERRKETMSDVIREIFSDLFEEEADKVRLAVTEEVTKEVTKEDVLKTIRLLRKYGVSDTEIRKAVSEQFPISKREIARLMKEELAVGV